MGLLWPMYGATMNKLSSEQALEIRARYLAGGVTLAALGREYGVDVSTASRIARGIYHPGSGVRRIQARLPQLEFERLHRLVDLLGVPPADVITRALATLEATLLPIRLGPGELALAPGR
jgi:hypothetical protein